MTQDRQSFISGRKGKVSIADLLIYALWPVNQFDTLIARSIEDLRSNCSSGLGFKVESSTVRSTLYRHPEIFQLRNKCGKIAYYGLADDFLKRIA